MSTHKYLDIICITAISLALALCALLLYGSGQRDFGGRASVTQQTFSLSGPTAQKLDEGIVSTQPPQYQSAREQEKDRRDGAVDKEQSATPSERPE